MMDRDEIDKLVRDEISRSEEDTEAAAAAREEIAADEEAERLLQVARERRGYR